MTRLHDNELDIDVERVRSLVDSQMSEHASLPLRELSSSGSTNRLFRLGDDLLVRLPRQPGNGEAIRKEERWVQQLSGTLGVDTPDIIYVGQPAHDFPEQWSVVRWIEGKHPSTANVASQDDQINLAKDLARVISALRIQTVPSNVDASLRWYRGAALSEFNEATVRAIAACREIPDLDLDLACVLEVWREAMSLPCASQVSLDTWYHADLVAENLLVRDGRLAAVLDWGVLGIGDPTVDLHGAWELFGPEAREVFRDELDVDDETWLCGRAWALGIAVGCFSYYWVKMPGRCADRSVMARAILDDFNKT